MKKLGAQPKEGVDPTAEGRPLALRLDHIDEDPGQPRSAANPGFTAHSLAELAASIRLRGVKTPISVRHHLPTSPGATSSTMARAATAPHGWRSWQRFPALSTTTTARPIRWWKTCSATN